MRFSTQAVALLILGFGTSNEFAPCSVTDDEQSAFGAIANGIQAAAKAMEYSETVGQNLAKLAQDWKCVEWKQKLGQARQDLEAKTITVDQAAEIEEQVARGLFEAIGKTIAVENDEEKKETEKLFDLAKVLERKKSSSFGYSQLFSIYGKSLGLSVEFIYSFQPPSDPLPAKRRHVNCGVALSNGKMIVADFPCIFLSKPFVFNDEFKEDGNYWAVKDTTDLLGIHGRVQRWDHQCLLAAIYSYRGEEAYNARKYAEALPHLNKAIALNPKYAMSYVGRGIVHSLLGETAAANDDMTKAVELDPKSPETYFARGYALMRAGKTTEAIADFDKALHLNPKFPMAYLCRSTSNSKLGKYAEAFSDTAKAIEIDPKNPKAYSQRASLHLGQNKYVDVLADAEKAIELDPKYATAYAQRSSAYAKLGKFAEAMADADKAVELDPQSPEHLYGRGCVHQQMGKYAEAAVDFSKAIELSPKTGLYYYGRGLARINLTNTDEAKSDLRKALELDPALKKPIEELSDRYSLDIFPPVL